MNKFEEINNRFNKVEPGPYEYIECLGASMSMIASDTSKVLIAGILNEGAVDSKLLKFQRNNGEFLAHSWEDIKYLTEMLNEAKRVIELCNGECHNNKIWDESLDLIEAETFDFLNKFKE